MHERCAMMVRQHSSGSGPELQQRGDTLGPISQGSHGRPSAQLSGRMTDFTVLESARLHLISKSPLTEMYTLSPFVWRGPRQYELLLRAVNHSEVAAEKVAESTTAIHQKAFTS